MKKNTLSQVFSHKARLLTAIVATLAFSTGGQAQTTLYWDGADTTVDADGGAGTWARTGTNWDDAPAGGNSVAWGGGSSAQNAVFGGAAGTVSITASTSGASLTAGDLNFAVSGYTLDMANGGTFVTASSFSGQAFTLTSTSSSTRVFNLNNSAATTFKGLLTLSSSTQGDRFTLNKSGAGTLVFDGTLGSGSNRPTLLVNGGTLQLGSTFAMGAAGSGHFTVSSGTFDLNGKSATIAKLQGTAGAILTNNAASTTSTLSIQPGTDATMAATIQDGASGAGIVAFVKQGGNNMVTVTAANTYSGGTTLTGSTGSAIAVGNNSALGTGVLNFANTSSGATVRLQSDTAANRTLANPLGSFGGTNAVYQFGTGTTGNLTFSNTATADIGTAARTFQISNATTEFNGGFTGTGSITKTGTGTMIMAGNSTYVGQTTISAGTLLVNNTAGSGTGTGAVVVNNGGTLGGTGSISGGITLNIGGTLSPGASVESLGAGDITFTGGTFLYEIDRNAAVGSRADLLFAADSSVGLSLSGAPALSLVDLNPGSAFAVGTKFTLFSYTTAVGWNGGTFTGFADDSTFTFAGNTWLIDYNDVTAGTNFSSEAAAAGSLFTTITAVPEPSTALMLLGGLGLLLSCQRARRRMLVQ